MTESLLFIIRYTPFWAVPFVLICLPFAYIFWLKDVRVLVYVFLLVAFCSALFILYWVWAGGPDKATQLFLEAVRSF